MVLISALLTVVFYVWTANSHGNSASLAPTSGDFYNAQADAFLDGRLSLGTAPRGLVDLDDPFDPLQNAAFRQNGLHDLSLYEGRIYSYFGVTPVVTFVLPARALGLGRPTPELTVLAFALLGTFAWVAALLRAVDWLWPDANDFLTMLGVLTIEFGIGVATLIRWAGNYSVPIAAGYCFLGLALLFLLRAATLERWRTLHIGLGSASLGLAVGARPNLVMAAVVLLCAAVVIVRRDPRSVGAQRNWPVAAAATPFVAVMIALGSYNFARFGNPVEFGISYQMSVDNMTSYAHFTLPNLMKGLWYYGLRPPDIDIGWPPVRLPDVAPSDLAFIRGGDYWLEPVSGLFVLLPFVGLGSAGLIALWVISVGDRRRASLAVGFAAVGLLLAAFTSSYLHMATFRYTVDFAPFFVLAATLGWVGIHERTGATRAGSAGVLGLAGVAALAGVIAGISISIPLPVA